MRVCVCAQLWRAVQVYLFESHDILFMCFGFCWLLHLLTVEAKILLVITSAQDRTAGSGSTDFCLLVVCLVKLYGLNAFT